MGPVEIAVFSFPGSQFNGQIAPALRELMAAETVRVLDRKSTRLNSSH